MRFGGGSIIFTQSQFTRGGGAYGATFHRKSVPLWPHTDCNPPVMVMKIGCALEVGTEGYMQLMEAAYPEFVDALRSKERTMILNINLSEKGKPPL